VKIAVLLDIHGNKDAIKAVLEDVKYRNIDKIYNLGDTLVEKRHGEWIVEQLSISYDTKEAIKQSEVQNRSDWARAYKIWKSFFSLKE